MQEPMKTLSAMKGLGIMVVGDLMLDTFIYGDVDRISPESPVPVLNIQKQDTMLGGAGNVLSNLCALGITPLCSPWWVQMGRGHSPSKSPRRRARM